jgi:predicted RNA-binding protein with PIN domain
MPYIIDGHNLIPKIPGLELDDLEDEKGLIELLQEFCQHASKDVHVYFDRAAVGGRRVQAFGRVTARFVSESETADIAIKRHLKRLGKAAKNWVVVSSDHEVMDAAKHAQTQVLRSEDFARQLTQPPAEAPTGDNPGQDDNIDEWLRLFSNGDDQD